MGEHEEEEEGEGEGVGEAPKRRANEIRTKYEQASASGRQAWFV